LSYKNVRSDKFCIVYGIFRQSNEMVSVLYSYQAFVLSSLSAKRKRCKGSGGVKSNDVISSLGAHQTARSDILRPLAHPSVFILLFSSVFLEWTYNLQLSSFGREARQPLLLLQVLLCLLTSPRLAFEYNTWLSLSWRIANRGEL